MKSKILTAFLLAIEDQHPMDEMIDEFCKKGGFERSELFITSRKVEFVRLKRLFANYMCDTHTKSEIARYLNMNHTTVMHYLNTHSENLRYDKTYNKMWVKLLS